MIIARAARLLPGEGELVDNPLDQEESSEGEDEDDDTESSDAAARSIERARLVMPHFEARNFQKDAIGEL